MKEFDYRVEAANQDAIRLGLSQARHVAVWLGHCVDRQRCVCRQTEMCA